MKKHQINIIDLMEGGQYNMLNMKVEVKDSKQLEGVLRG